jgi:hypothetical protein
LPVYIAAFGRLFLLESTMTVKSQGTHLYFLNTTDTVAALVKLICPTGISGLNSGAKDQTDVTCLDDVDDRKFRAGLGNPGQTSVPFNLHPEDASQQLLFDLKDSGETIPWMACLSDGTAAPTLEDDEIVPAAGRTCFGFDAYVQEVTIDVATNDVVKGTLTLQRSGKVRRHWKS